MLGKMFCASVMVRGWEMRERCLNGGSLKEFIFITCLPKHTPSCYLHPNLSVCMFCFFLPCVQNVTRQPLAVCGNSWPFIRIHSVLCDFSECWMVQVLSLFMRNRLANARSMYMYDRRGVIFVAFQTFKAVEQARLHFFKR